MSVMMMAMRPGYEVVPADQCRVEPDAHIGYNGNRKRLTLKTGLLLQPDLPGSIHIILDNASLIGVDAVHGEMNGRLSGTQGEPRKVTAQPEYGGSPAAHHSLLRRCLIGVARRVKPRGMVQLREERCCEIRRLVDHLGDGNASCVQ